MPTRAIIRPWALRLRNGFCLDLAWQAFGAGSVPIGAVVLCGSGTVVSSGRSRMYETRAPTPEIANSLLAHAEVNALVKLDPRRPTSTTRDEVLRTDVLDSLLTAVSPWSA